MAVNSAQAIIDGQTYILTLNTESGNYEASVTAPAKSSYQQSGHYYNVQIEATDDAGNVTAVDATDVTLGTSLQLVVKEKVAPIITITQPTSGALISNNKPPIQWTVKDDDSGVDTNTIGITIDSGTKITTGITKTEITDGYSCEYILTDALVDGNHTITFDASDNDGNAATQKSVTFDIDTVPPALSIDSPEDDFITNNANLVISGTTTDPGVNSATLTVQVNSGTPTDITVNEDGTFSTTVTLAEGSNVITVVSTDSTNKTTTIVRNVDLDTVAPVIQSVTLTPNPADAGQTYIISVTVTDA